MSQLVRFLLAHAVLGFAIAVVAVSGILLFGNGPLGLLVHSAEFGWLALALMTFMIGLTCASVQMGVAVMLLRERDDGTPRGGRRHHVLSLVLAWLTPPRLAPVRADHS